MYMYIVYYTHESNPVVIIDNFRIDYIRDLYLITPLPMANLTSL